MKNYSVRELDKKALGLMKGICNRRPAKVSKLEKVGLF